jgi:hypothetical protein
MVALKISLCLFYLRITVLYWQRYAIYIIASTSIIFGFAYFLFILFQCGAPVESKTFWLKRIEEECVSRASILGMGYTHGVISSLTDLSLVVLPIPIILQARINRNEKIIVTIIIMTAGVYV